MLKRAASVIAIFLFVACEGSPPAHPRVGTDIHFPPSGGGTTYTAGAGIGINGAVISNTSPGLGSAVTTTDGGVAFNVPITSAPLAETKSLMVGGPTNIPVAGSILGSFSNANARTTNFVAANASSGTGAGVNMTWICGSWDGSAGPNTGMRLNSNTRTGLGGPSAWLLIHSPDVGAPIIFYNSSDLSGSDITFWLGGATTEALRIVGAGANVVKVGTPGIQAAGSTAVTLTNSPGSSATPAEYWKVQNAAGQTRYIPLLQ